MSGRADIRSVQKMLAPVRRALSGLVLRGVITLANDAAALQRVQVQLRAMPQPDGSIAAELASDVEVLRQYGFSSMPHEGAEAVMLAVGGIKKHGLIIAVDDRRYRLQGLQGGEVVLYDDLGNVVKLGRDELSITGKTKVHVTAPTVLVEGDEIQIGEGGKAVARDGDPVVGGKVQATSTKVTAA